MAYLADKHPSIIDMYLSGILKSFSAAGLYIDNLSACPLLVLLIQLQIEFYSESIILLSKPWDPKTVYPPLSN